MKKIAMLILILLFSLNTSVASAQKAQYEEFYNPAGFRAEWSNPYSEEYVASLDKKFTEWEKSMGQEYYSITLDNENKLILMMYIIYSLFLRFTVWVQDLHIKMSLYSEQQMKLDFMLLI